MTDSMRDVSCQYLPVNESNLTPNQQCGCKKVRVGVEAEVVVVLMESVLGSK